MGHELGRALLLSDAVSPDAMAEALLASVRDRVSLVRALLSTGAIPMGRLEDELARTSEDAPVLRHPVPVLDLIARLPEDLCAALVAVPVRADPRTGTVDVAVADPSDTHAAEEIGFHLSAPVRLLRSPLGAIESAIDQARQARLAKSMRDSSSPPSSGPISVPPPSPVRPMMHTPPWGSPPLEAPTDEQLANLSERPLPLIPRPPSERVAEEDAAERSLARATPGADIAIPLARRLTPGSGLVALARAAQALDDDEDPVVELRRPKSSTPPEIIRVEPSRADEDTRSAAAPGDDRTITQPSTPLNQILREMSKVTARDPLMELVLIAVRPTAPKSALFAAKKDAFAGWMCTSDFGDRDLFAEVRIDARKPSLFSTTAAAGTFIGPMLRNETHAPLAQFIRSQQPEVVGVAIRAAGRPAVILIAHEIPEPLRAMTTLAEVARVAGEALERILRAKR